MADTNRFKALVVEQSDDGTTEAAIQELDHASLPEGDVLVAVTHSSVNYKDGLAVTGKGKIVRRFPMVPGIDLAGTVVESSSPRFAAGDPVLVTGYGIGETHWGGYAQMARVHSDWVVPLPDGLSLEQAMAIGTAGFTAMLCTMELEGRGLKPDDGEVLVTGAGGGVGSIAVALLGQLGYRVVASTGRPEIHDYLQALGAADFIHRDELAQTAKPLETERWAGAIDNVGGQTLATVLAFMGTRTTVAACGVAGGHEVNTTVFPFILRGVALVGITSVSCPYDHRFAAWQRLARDLPLDKLETMYHVARLDEVPRIARDILKGRVRGRTVIDVNA